MSSSVADDAIGRWRQKYYDSLEQLETQERHLHEVETTLRRGIAYLSHALDKFNPAMEGHLCRLRQALHDGKDVSVVQGIIGEIAEAAERLAGSGGSSSASATTLRFMNDLLAELTFPPGIVRSVNALRKRISNHDASQDIALLLHEFAALLSDAMRRAGEPTEGGASVQGGLLSRLRAGLRAGEDKCLGERVSSQPGADDVVPPEIGEVLLQLLERLDLPVEMEAQVDALKADLEDGVDAQEVRGALASIASLVTEMRTRIEKEKHDLERFLQQLTTRLQDLDQHLQTSEADRAESIKSGRELDAVMKAGVKGIEDTVKDAVELDHLKVVIQGQLETIQGHIDAYLTSEEQRNLRAEEEVRELTSRLHQMEVESENLRARILQEHQQALNDPLTGIHNRLAYNERITQEYARWKRYLTPLTLVIWDLDLFKDINDTYGHKAGDKVLRTIARLLQSQLRETDFLARYGGEEFVTLMPETPLGSALAVAGKLGNSVENCGFHYQGNHVPITISCGLAEFHDGDTPESVFTRADAALYRAKQAGRNRCMTEE